MPCRAPVAEPAIGGRARWRVEGGWRASCGSLDGGAWPSRPQHRGGRQWEGRRDRVVEADRRGSSKGQGRGRWEAPCTHNTHCTLKLSLVSRMYVYKGVGVGDYWRGVVGGSSGATPRSGGSRRTDCETGVSGWNPILL